jgi:mRNA deadenylase 3'-5' endonuclease subunit Ccr4
VPVPSEPMPDARRALCVVSHNVLAPALAHPEYFPSQPEWVMRWSRRSAVLRREWGLRRPDVLCLQEVQESLWESDFLRPLQAQGFDGRFIKRTGASPIAPRLVQAIVRMGVRSFGVAIGVCLLRATPQL